MAGRIPESFIQDLLARVDIVSIVEARVPLKRAGKEYTALCPFHAENSPSFTVSPQKQFYHCFGCGAHGSAIGFLMEYDRLEFLDAVEELARGAGMEIPREVSSQPRPDQDLYAVLAEAEAFYRRKLKQTPAAIDYLRERGLSGELAARFALGVAPTGWQALTDALGSSSRRRKLLERAGLVSVRDDGGCYDKFRGRIIFPIHDTRGRAVAFGGRIYGDQEGPKYLNSPETELFHKGRQLYGLYEARQAVGRLDRLVVVEGYMDVLALAQHGVPETVATLGTATTEDHASLLFRSAPQVVFCFDGDRAGRQAAERAMESVLGQLSEGRQVRFLFLPEGEDPDSLVRAEGEQSFRDRLDRATPFSEFFFARLQSQVDMSSLDGRSRLVELARPLIAKMPPGAFHDMMNERLSELARTRVAADASERSAPPRRAPPNREKMSLVRTAIRALLQAPALAGDVRPAPEVTELERPGIDLLLSLLEWCREHPDSTTAQLLQHYSDHPQAGALAKLAAAGLLVEQEDELKAELSGALRGLERVALREKMASLRQDAQDSGLAALNELPRLRERLRTLESGSD